MRPWIFYFISFTTFFSDVGLLLLLSHCRKINSWFDNNKYSSKIFQSVKKPNFIIGNNRSIIEMPPISDLIISPNLLLISRSNFLIILFRDLIYIFF